MHFPFDRSCLNEVLSVKGYLHASFVGLGCAKPPMNSANWRFFFGFSIFRLACWEEERRD